MFQSMPAIGLGIGIIGTILRNAGHEVRIIDNNAIYKMYSDGELLKIAKDFKPDIFAFNVNFLNALDTYNLIKKLKVKYPGHLFVGGGIHMRFCAHETLEHGFDVVARYEGETIAGPIFKHLEGRTREDYRDGLDKIPGILFTKEDGGVFESPETPVIENLDEVPYPDLNLFNLQNYYKLKTEPAVVHINGQRGCPFKCVFCIDEFTHSDKRVSSAEYMFNWVKYYYENWGIRYYFIVDNNFMIPSNRVEKFCRMMIESGLNREVNITVQTKLETINTKGPISMLREAGIFKVQIGLERLTPYSMKMIRKESSPEKVEKVMSWFRDSGVFCQVNILIGFPFETIETLRAEREAFLKLTKNTQTFLTGIMQPMPGTPYYDDYPKVHGWHLNPMMNRITKSYYGTVMDLATWDALKFNFFDLPQDVIQEIDKFYLEFKNLNHGSYILNETLFSKVMVGLDKLVARFSLLFFHLSPSAEQKLFSKVKALRYYFGMVFFAKRVTKLGFAETESLQDHTS